MHLFCTGYNYEWFDTNILCSALFPVASNLIRGYDNKPVDKYFHVYNYINNIFKNGFA